MLNKIVRGLLVGTLAFAGATAVASAPAQAAAKTYKNCTALNKVYKHGVGKKGAGASGIQDVAVRPGINGASRINDSQTNWS